MRPSPFCRPQIKTNLHWTFKSFLLKLKMTPLKKSDEELGLEDVWDSAGWRKRRTIQGIGKGTSKDTGTLGPPTESTSDRINKWTERRKSPACSGKVTGQQGLGTSVRDNVARDEKQEIRGRGGMRVRRLGEILLVTAHHLHLRALPRPRPQKHHMWAIS